MRVPNFAKQLFVCSFALLFASVDAYAATESVIYTFSPFNQPSQLIQASDGNFYGTAPSGGSSSAGFVFRLTPSGTETVIHNFTGAADGGVPRASLIEGNDGNLYGTTTTGGIGNGTIFQMTLAGAVTVLHNFASTDGTSTGALIETNAGDFFGAATSGGSSNSGTIYEYSHTGTFLIWHTFTGIAGDGALPNTQLVQASDGLIYGATRKGGSTGSIGSLFRFNPANLASFVTFASFPPTNQSDPAYNPTFGMTEGTDGALYGLTSEGGSGFSGYGTVYKVTLGAAPSVAINHFSFNGGTQGGLPESGLSLGGDGNFYGTTSSYGPGGPPNGTIFQYPPAGSGSLSTLYPFSSPNGDPTGTPLEAADGNFYGPASAQIYKLTMSPTIPAPVTLTASSPAVSLGTSVTLSWNVTNAFSETAQNCYAHGSWSGSKATTGTLTLTPNAAGVYTYSLTCGGVESALTTVTVLPVIVLKVATPVIAPNGGSFNGPVDYNITDATSGAVIHYTTNGTTPTAASPVWGGVPLVLVTNATIKAIAVHTSMTDSAVATASFTFNPTSPSACTINYSNGFSASTGLQLNHGATVSGSVLEMTHGLINENTSAFATIRIPLKVFVTEFRFRFAKATATSADGLTFTLSAKSDLLIGTNGAGLGYATIPSSMALKFDLANNAGEGVNSVGLYFNGVLPTTPAVDLTPSGVNLHSGNIMDAYITYDSVNLTLVLTDTITGAHFSHNFPLPTTSPIGATSAYAGFTASTDRATSNAQVLLWGLQSAGTCLK